MEHFSFSIPFIVYFIIYFVCKNRYGGTRHEFQKIYRNKQFIINNNLRLFKKIATKLVCYSVFIILLFMFLISSEVMSSIFMYSNNLKIEPENDTIYLDYSSSVGKIKNIVNNKTILEFNSIGLVNIVQLSFSILFSLLVFLYIKISDTNKYKDEIGYMDYEIESKKYGFNKLSYKKLYITVFILIILHFIFQCCNVFMQLEKPNIDGFIDNNENLFNLLKVNVTKNYSYTLVESSMSGVQILFLLLSCSSLLTVIILLSLHDNYNGLIFRNNFYKIYLESNKNK